MIKQSIFILVFFVVSSLSACAQQPQDSCNKYSEPSIGVSFCAPPKWRLIKEPDDPYQKVFGEDNSNINVVSSEYDASLTELATKMIDALLSANYAKENGFSSIKLESRSEFIAEKIRGYRTAYISEKKGIKLRTIQYLFAGKGKMKIVITAVSDYADKDTMDKIFDDAMKTFEVSN